MMRGKGARHRRDTIRGSAGEGGFTLVELLVTIAMIAVLAALIFMISRKAIDRAKATKNMANLRSLATQMQNFAADQGYFPPGFDSNFPANSSFTNIRWPEILLENIGAKPAREEYLSPTKGSKLEAGMTWQPLNYAANVAVCYRTGGKPVRTANIQRPNEVVLLGDVTTKQGAESTPHKNGHANLTPTNATLSADTPAAGQNTATFTTGTESGKPDYRNNGEAHMIFVDGHIQGFKQGALKAKHFSIRY